MTRPVPDLVLERLHRGELGPAERAAWAERLAADPSVPSRLQALANDDAATLLAHPPARVAAEIRRRAGVSAPRAARGWVALGGLVAAAAGALLLVGRTGEGPADDVRTKGAGPALLVETVGAETRAVADGDRLAPGARLRVGLSGLGGQCAAVLARSGGGVALLGGGLDPAVPQPGDAPRWLELTLVVDGAAAAEELVLVSGPCPLAPAAARAAAAGQGDPGLRVDRTRVRVGD